MNNDEYLELCKIANLMKHAIKSIKWDVFKSKELLVPTIEIVSGMKNIVKKVSKIETFPESFEG
jgi:hypothetical protein